MSAPAAISEASTATCTCAYCRRHVVGSATRDSDADPMDRSLHGRWSRLPIRLKLWLLMLPVQLLGLTIPAYWLWRDYSKTKERSYQTLALSEAERLTQEEVTKAREEYVYQSAPLEGGQPAAKVSASARQFAINLGLEQNVSVSLRIDYRTSDVFETTSLPTSSQNPAAREMKSRSQSPDDLGALNELPNLPVRAQTLLAGVGWNENPSWRHVLAVRDPNELPEEEIRAFISTFSADDQGAPGPLAKRKQWIQRRSDRIRILTIGEVASADRIIATIMTVPMAPLHAATRQAMLWTAVVVLISITFLLPAIHFAIGVPVLGPVQELAQRMRSVDPDSMGEMRLPVTRQDEIGDLQQSFNVMAGEIAEKQAELLQHKQMLEARVAERTAELAGRNEELSHANSALVQTQMALESVNDELAKSNRELDAFAYTVSHDLQAPLRNVSFLVKEEIPEAIGKQDTTEVYELLAMASQLCEFNIEMVKALLEWARIQQLTTEPVDLNQVVEQVRMGLRAQLEERGATIRVANPLPVVLCDRIHLNRVLTNLVTNGVKYNDQAEKLIEIGTQTLAGIGLAVYVRDNGIGIESRNMSKLFNLLVQLHKQDRYGKGIGMGLAIVKRTLERYDGKIWAESTYGAGTTFWFTLPLAKTGADS